MSRYIPGPVDDVEKWIIGIKWDTTASSPTLTRIDVDGNTVTKASSWFDSHPLFGNIWRCTIEPGETPIYGSNSRGDGLTLDGSTGDVMVHIPQSWWKWRYDAPYFMVWVSPQPYPGFSLHPAYFQRGGFARDLYVGAYAGNLGVDSSGNIVLRSFTGAEPFCGGGTHVVIPFTSGSMEPTIGETITGATSAETGILEAVYLASGSWGGGDAAGNLYIRQPSAADTFGAENLDGSISGNDFATTTGGSDLDPTKTNFRTYAENRWGANGGICSTWTIDSLLRQMIYIEFATFRPTLETYIGRGVVDLASGIGFAGKLNGADSTDTNVGTNGTGTGTGTNGETPISWRGIENVWGNVWQWVDGIDLTDTEVRIIKGSGEGEFADPIGAGDYESTTFAPTQVDGYITGIEHGDVLGLMLMLPDEPSGGSSGTYLCDYLYAFDPGSLKCVLAGGRWADGADAGVACRYARSAAADSASSVGARAEVLI